MTRAPIRWRIAEIKKTIGLVMVCALGLVAADGPLIGTWKLNVAKSTFSPGPAPQSETVIRGADNKVVVSGVNEKGETENWWYVSTPSGSPITGVPDATVLETRKGRVVDDVWKIGNAIQKGHGEVSKASLAFSSARLRAEEPGSKGWRTFEVITRVEILSSPEATRVWLPEALITDTPFQRTLFNHFRADGARSEKPNLRLKQCQRARTAESGGHGRGPRGVRTGVQTPHKVARGVQMESKSVTCKY